AARRPAVQCNKVSPTPHDHARRLQVFMLGVAETSLLCDHEKVALSSRLPFLVHFGFCIS
ncbi:MAG: hypothetical protein ABSF67_24670, partial [Roseiarcus sp.]